MKFHILYNNETIIPNISQNIRKWPVSYDIDNAEVVLTFELNTYSVTKKFANLWETTHSNALRQNGGRQFEQQQQVFTRPTPERIMRSRELYNKTLQEIIPFVSRQSAAIIVGGDLNVEISTKPYLEKFNRAHELFEKECASVMPTGNKYEGAWEKWQLIHRNRLQLLNSIIHFNEEEIRPNPAPKYTTIISTAYNSDHMGDNNDSFLMADNFYRDMVPSDYRAFSFGKGVPGTLYLDFATLGKCLTEIAGTNDVRLLRTEGPSQQKTIWPWVRYSWEPPQPLRVKQYNKWIIKNKVGELLDLSNPMYKPGLHPLGVCTSHDFKNPKEFENFIQDRAVIGTVLER